MNEKDPPSAFISAMTTEHFVSGAQMSDLPLADGRPDNLYDPVDTTAVNGGRNWTGRVVGQGGHTRAWPPSLRSG